MQGVLDTAAVWFTLASEFFALQLLVAVAWLSETHRQTAGLLLLAMAAKLALSKYVKMLASAALPPWLTRRPECDRCSLLAQPSPPGKEHTGLPSGHAWHAAALVSVAYCHGGVDSRLTWYAAALFLGTCWSRWHLGCHTMVQVAAGALIGVGWGLGVYRATSPDDLLDSWLH